MVQNDDDIHTLNLVAFMRNQVIEEDQLSHSHLLNAIKTIDDCIEEIRKIVRISKIKGIKP